MLVWVRAFPPFRKVRERMGHPGFVAQPRNSRSFVALRLRMTAFWVIAIG